MSERAKRYDSFLTLVGAQKLVGLRAWLAFSVIMILGRWSIVYGTSTFVFTHFLVEAISAQIITGIAGYLILRVYQQEDDDPLINAKRNLSLVIFLGALNGLSWIVSIEIVGKIPVSPELAITRVFMTSVIALVLFIGFSRYEDLRWRYLQVRREVALVNEHLNYLTEHAQELIVNQTQLIQDSTRDELIPRITELQESLQQQSQVVESAELVAKLQQVINAGVRPISHQLASVKPQVNLPSGLVKIPGFFSINPRINVARAIDPQSWLIYPFPLLVGSQLQLNGLSGLLPMLFYIAFGVVLAKVVALIIPDRDLPVAIGATVLLVLSVVIPILGSRATVSLFDSAPSTWGFIPERIESEYLGAGPLFFFFAFYANLLTNNYRDLTKRLAALKATEDRELAGLRQQLWATNRNWAYLLHGKVQASLTAALTRLKLGMTTVDDLDLVNDDLQRALTAISSAPQLEVDFSEQMSQIQMAWQGICAFNFSVSSAAQRTIDKDSALAFALNEVVREAISNAIRHGGAKNVDVAIDFVDSLLKLEIINDGELDVEKSASLGMSLLDELTLDWQLGGVGGEVRLLATLATNFDETSV